MKTLEQIEKEVGPEIFKRWKHRAEVLLHASPFRYHEAEAQHAFIYENIMTRYDVYRKAYHHHEPHIREVLKGFRESIKEGAD